MKNILMFQYLDNTCFCKFLKIGQKIRHIQMADSNSQNNQYGVCPVHNQPALYICSVQNCKQHRLICQICKQKQIFHFSEHANYIYRIKEFKQFQTSKSTIPRLQKGVSDCEVFVVGHKKIINQQLNMIRQDFKEMKKEFNNVADKYENIYTSIFQRQMQKYDSKIQDIKLTLKQYIKQKNHQDSFFTMLFHEKKTENSLQNVIVKNSKAFRVRADIISLRSQITIDKNNNKYYRATDSQNRKFSELYNYLIDFSTNFFDKFKILLNSSNKSDNDNLRNSIVSQTKSLSLSRVSVGSPVQFYDLNKSRASINSDFNLQRVQLPNPHPKVAQLRDKLQQFLPPKNATLDGPFLYSSGVYLGQMREGRRNGFGSFIFNDGTLYQGGWENDCICGYGRLIKKNCYYEGEVKNGRAHGKGNYEDQYRTYTGEWREDKRSGIGEQQFKTKRKKYVGMFLNDKYNGKGKLIDEEYVYDGKFKDGYFHGEGLLSYKNKEVFHGTFNEGYRNFGRHTYPDGSYYDGMFKDNVPNGTGQFYWPDGLKYTGQWKNGMQEGVGVQISYDGKQKRGSWKNGQWQKWL